MIADLFTYSENFNPEHFIVIKDEKTVVDLSYMKHVICGLADYKRTIQERLEKA